MGEAVLRAWVRDAHLDGAITVSSYGTHRYHEGEDADHRALRVLRRHGYEIDHLARQLTPRELGTVDVLLTMDRDHFKHAMDMSQRESDESGEPLADRVEILPWRSFDPMLKPTSLRDQNLDVPDPYYGHESGFVEVLDMLERVREPLLQFLRERALTH
jgi:protein-tyrosine phosphatase